jgi:hypothetical protein
MSRILNLLFERRCVRQFCCLARPAQRCKEISCNCDALPVKRRGFWLRASCARGQVSDAKIASANRGRAAQSASRTDDQFVRRNSASRGERSNFRAASSKISCNGRFSFSKRWLLIHRTAWRSASPWGSKFSFTPLAISITQNVRGLLECPSPAFWRQEVALSRTASVQRK